MCLLISIYDVFFFLFFFKGRSLKFRRYRNFSNLFSKLSESTFSQRNKQVSVKKYRVKSTRLAVLQGIS